MGIIVHFLLKIKLQVVAILVVVNISGVSGARLARAQNTDLQANASADSLFDAGVSAFRKAHYDEARAAFLEAAEMSPLHTKTTASTLMAAKAAYRLRDYQATSRELSRFLDAYSSSSYLDEAKSLLTMAGTILQRSGKDILSIGIILSLDQQEVSQTQAMFNGIKLAVAEYNRTSEEHRIRMIFRDTGSRPSTAANAVYELAAEGVEFIVGTLFSEQAIAAAQAADENEIVFIAPLATDERVTDGRRYAFQANPSIRMRGSLMARFAVNGLRLHSLGVLASEDPEHVGERLADSFIEEASRLGAEINFVSVLKSANEWVRLSEIITADTLLYMDALYIPITEIPPEPAIGAVFSSMNRLRADIRILGNASYHDIPMLSDASRYQTTYSNDFNLDPESERVIAFEQMYKTAHNNTPGRLVYTGYDVTTFLLQTLDFAGQDPLVDVLPGTPIFEGIALRIGFEGGNINRSMFYYRYRDGELQLLR